MENYSQLKMTTQSSWYESADGSIMPYELSSSVFQSSDNYKRKRRRTKIKRSKFRLGRYTAGHEKPFYDTDQLGEVINV